MTIAQEEDGWSLEEQVFTVSGDQNGSLKLILERERTSDTSLEALAIARCVLIMLIGANLRSIADG